MWHRVASCGFVCGFVSARIEDTELALTIIVNSARPKLNTRLHVHEIHNCCLNHSTEPPQERKIVAWKIADNSLVVLNEIIVRSVAISMIRSYHPLKLVIARKHCHDVLDVGHCVCWGLSWGAGFNF